MGVEIPSLFICSFCRGGCEGVPGINSLSECGPRKLFDLDISLEEKQELIVLQTEQIEELFEQVQKDRKANLQYSIELINSILNR